MNGFFWAQEVSHLQLQVLEHTEIPSFSSYFFIINLVMSVILVFLILALHGFRDEHLFQDFDTGERSFTDDKHNSNERPEDSHVVLVCFAKFFFICTLVFLCFLLFF